MDLKEFFMTALAVAIGVIIAKIINNKVPQLGGTAEETYDAEYDAAYDSE